VYFTSLIQCLVLQIEISRQIWKKSLVKFMLKQKQKQGEHCNCFTLTGPLSFALVTSMCSSKAEKVIMLNWKPIWMLDPSHHLEEAKGKKMNRPSC